MLSANMLRMRADISISNPKWRRRLADYLGIKNQLLVAKNAPNYMSGILLLAKDASLVEDFNDRSRREIIGFRRRPYEIELILGWFLLISNGFLIYFVECLN